jgi:outer membrane protein assembly factor BamB
MRKIALFGLTALLVPLALAGDWPQFRGPDGRAVGSDTGLPATWSEKENVRWKIELPGKGVSNPVIMNGRLFVTACSGPDNERLHVLCFDANTGKKLWERTLRATGGTACHPKTNMAAPTPATDGKDLFALFATGDLACFDVNGDLRWYRSLVGDYPLITNQVGMAASPVLHKNVVIVPMENVGESFIAGIDRETGKNIWKHPREREISWNTPFLFQNGDRTEVVIQSGQGVVALDPLTGKKHWGWAGKGISSVITPMSEGGVLYLNAGGMVALKPSKDRPEPELLWHSDKLGGAYATPLVHQGLIYVPNTRTGVIACASTKDGNVIWQHRHAGPYWASPIAADGKMYMINEEGLTAVLKLGGEQPTLLGTNPLGETVLATPAVANGALYLRGYSTIWCIAEKKR